MSNIHYSKACLDKNGDYTYSVGFDKYQFDLFTGDREPDSSRSYKHKGQDVETYSYVVDNCIVVKTIFH